MPSNPLNTQKTNMKPQHNTQTISNQTYNIHGQYTLHMHQLKDPRSVYSHTLTKLLTLLELI
jgi:hypothetical protein